jgi:hypothetical protein
MSLSVSLVTVQWSSVRRVYCTACAQWQTVQEVLRCAVRNSDFLVLCHREYYSMNGYMSNELADMHLVCEAVQVTMKGGLRTRTF